MLRIEIVVRKAFVLDSLLISCKDYNLILPFYLLRKVDPSLRAEKAILMGKKLSKTSQMVFEDLNATAFCYSPKIKHEAIPIKEILS